MTTINKLVCPGCGSPILDTSKSCRYCGSKLALSDDRKGFILVSYICEKCDCENKESDRYCWKCGKKLVKTCTTCHSEIRTRAEHCTNCGVLMTDQGDQPTAGGTTSHEEPKSTTTSQSRSVATHGQRRNLTAYRPSGFTRTAIGLVVIVCVAAAAYVVGRSFVNDHRTYVRTTPNENGPLVQPVQPDRSPQTKAVKAAPIPRGDVLAQLITDLKAPRIAEGPLNAAQRLERLRDPKNIDALMDAFVEEYPRYAGPPGFVGHQRGSGREISRLTHALLKEDPGLADRIEPTEGGTGSSNALEVLMCGLFNNTSAWINVIAACILMTKDPEIPVTFFALLQHENPRIRYRAADALGKFKDQRSIEPLIEALSDPDQTVRSSAAYSLGPMRNDAAVEPLIETYRNGNVYVKKAACYALGWIGGSRARDTLLHALKDGNSLVCEGAASSLAQMYGHGIVKPLRAALHAGKSAEIRTQANLLAKRLSDVPADR